MRLKVKEDRTDCFIWEEHKVIKIGAVPCALNNFRWTVVPPDSNSVSTNILGHKEGCVSLTKLLAVKLCVVFKF
jgi:hypothetical protein